jgi:hypothetical protein
MDGWIEKERKKKGEKVPSSYTTPPAGFEIILDSCMGLQARF